MAAGEYIGFYVDSSCVRIVMAEKERSFTALKVTGKTNKTRVKVVGKSESVGVTVGDDEQELTATMHYMDAVALQADVRNANDGQWKNTFFDCTVEVTIPGGVSKYEAYKLSPLDGDGADIKAGDAGALTRTFKFIAFAEPGND